MLRSIFTRCTVLAFFTVLLLNVGGFALAADNASGGEPPTGFVKITEDDCGVPKSQPHFVGGSSWTYTDEERKGSDVTDPRLLSFNHGDSISYRYVGLRPDAKYAIVVTCFNLVQERRQEVLVNGRLLDAAHDLPIGKPVVRSLTLPPDSYLTGRATITFRKVAGFSGIL